jgi:hypothetical protein
MGRRGVGLFLPLPLLGRMGGDARWMGDMPVRRHRPAKMAHCSRLRPAWPPARLLHSCVRLPGAERRQPAPLQHRVSDCVGGNGPGDACVSHRRCDHGLANGSSPDLAVSRGTSPFHPDRPKRCPLPARLPNVRYAANDGTRPVANLVCGHVRRQTNLKMAPTVRAKPTGRASMFMRRK